MGTLINDIESEDTLVPTELLALVKLIMVTTNMKRWIEHKVYPVSGTGIYNLLLSYFHVLERLRLII